MHRDPVGLAPAKKEDRSAPALKLVRVAIACGGQLFSKRLSRRAWATLSVGYAAAEGGYGFCFVGEGGGGVDQASQLEDFPDMASWIEDFQAATLALEADEGAHQCADARAIDLRDAGEIDNDLGWASIGKFA